MSGDILAIILITIALTSALLVINLRSWRGHRVYLLSTALGLSILSFSSGEINHFYTNFCPISLITCLVTLFDCKLQFFKSLQN